MYAVVLRLRPAAVMVSTAKRVGSQGMRNFYLDFLQEMSSADTISEQREALSKVLSEFGFSRFVYGLAPTSPNGETTDYVSVSTLDAEWMEVYVSENLYANDYALWHCLNGERPLPWSKIYGAIDNKVLPRNLERTAQIARDVGVGVGLTVPLFTTGPFKAGVSLVADKEAKQSDTERAFFQHEKALIDIMDAFHILLDRKQIACDHYKLSNREIEVLKWQMHGLRIDQIPERTGTALSTVEKQALSARRKLKSATNAQAVARAVALGII